MAHAKKRAPSLWLKYTDGDAGDILMQNVLVPSSGLAKYTYYCLMNWNTCAEGGGYCGIQDHPDGRAYIFSIWDPQQVKDVPITAVSKGPGTWTERFGGEGTGLKSMNFELGWKEDQWYTMVVRRWDSSGGQATQFGCWVLDWKECTWTHLVTMEYPVPQVYFKGVVCSFLEDWASTSENSRCVYYKGAFKRRQDKTWIPVNNVDFEVNTYDIEQGTATENYSAKCPDPKEGVLIMAGGDVTSDIGTRCRFSDQSHGLDSFKPIKLERIDVRGNQLNWVIDTSGAPQFAYRIKCGDEEVCSEIGDNTTVTCPDGRTNITISVEVEDIFGNCDQQEYQLSTTLC